MGEFVLRSQYGHLVAETDGAPLAAIEDADFKERLINQVFPEMGLLPPAVRWISPGRRFIVFERPPQYQTIYFQAAAKGVIEAGRAKVTPYSFRIPLPWTLYAIQLNNDYIPVGIAVFALRHPIRTENDRLGVLPLPNFYDSGALCQPHFNPADEETASIAQGLDLAYRLTWHGGFNHDLLGAFHYCRKVQRPSVLFPHEGYPGRQTPLRVFRRWQKLSLQDIANEENVWRKPTCYALRAQANFHLALTTINDLTNGLTIEEQSAGIGNPYTNSLICLRQLLL